VSSGDVPSARRGVAVARAPLSPFGAPSTSASKVTYYLHGGTDISGATVYGDLYSMVFDPSADTAVFTLLHGDTVASVRRSFAAIGIDASGPSTSSSFAAASLASPIVPKIYLVGGHVTPGTAWVFANGAWSQILTSGGVSNPPATVAAVKYAATVHHASSVFLVGGVNAGGVSQSLVAEFYWGALVLGVAPKLVPFAKSQDALAVTITGRHLHRAENFAPFRTCHACNWGAEQDTAATLALTGYKEELTCALPASTPGTVIRVRVRAECDENSLLSSAQPASHLLASRAHTVLRAYPTVLTASMVGSITVVGTNFVKALSGALCDFGLLGTTVATIRTSQVATCAVPLPASLAVPITLTVDLVNGDLGASGDSAAVVTVHADPVVTAVVPTAGPQEGGYVVTIHGRNFLASASAVCAFGDLDHLSTASVVSASVAVCTLPAQGSATPGSVIVELLDAPDASASCTSSVSFAYATGPLVTAMVPASGLTTAATPVTVHGGPFLVGATMCRFAPMYGRSAGTVVGPFSGTLVTASSFVCT
jgi:hypothetical protein